MATTTNFGWETPDDTDLVKDGAAAMRTLGNSIDTSFVDLKGGTTGQVLSKASGTDLDFTWVAQDDSNAIQNAIVDAKGDLIAATAADTPARLAVGTNGQVLTADSTAATGLKWASVSAGLVAITPSSISVGSGSASSAGNGQVTFTTVGTNLSLNGVFSSTYDNYLLVFQTTFSTATQLSIRYRASGTDTTTGYYMNLVDYYSNGTTVDYNFANNASLIALADNGVVEMGFEASVRNPYATKKTLFTAQYNNWQTSTVRAQNGLNFGTQSDTTAFDGITFIPTSGTISGTVSVYGLAK